MRSVHNTYPKCNRKPGKLQNDRFFERSTICPVLLPDVKSNGPIPCLNPANRTVRQYGRHAFEGLTKPISSRVSRIPHLLRAACPAPRPCPLRRVMRFTLGIPFVSIRRRGRLTWLRQFLSCKEMRNFLISYIHCRRSHMQKSVC